MVRFPIKFSTRCQLLATTATFLELCYGANRKNGSRQLVTTQKFGYCTSTAKICFLTMCNMRFTIQNNQKRETNKEFIGFFADAKQMKNYASQFKRNANFYKKDKHNANSEPLLLRSYLLLRIFVFDSCTSKNKNKLLCLR